MTGPVRRRAATLIPDRVASRIAALTPARVELPTGHRFRMLTSNGDGIAKRLWWHGIDGFEPESLQFWARTAATADFVLDIGANTGAYALTAASLSSCPVLALEPVPVIAAELRRNVALNRFEKVQVLEAAASDAVGTAQLYVPHEGLATEASLLAGFRPSLRAIEVEVTTIDALVETYGLTGAGLIKIDTEATEHLVLSGASATMGDLRPLFVVEVLRGRTESAIEPLLAHHGYASLWMGSAALPERKLEGDPSERILNWVLAPAKKVVALRAGMRDAA